MTITIDGKEFAPDELSDNAKEQLASMKIADQRIAQLQSELAIAQTARNAYARALADEMSKTE
jgi:hypothetical protein